MVTLGGENLDLPNYAMPNYPSPKYTNGRVRNVTDIEGAILINGDYILDNASYRGTIGEKAGNTKSFIKGSLNSNITPATQIITDQNYIDFNKMYKSILVESQALADKTEYHINNPKLEITKPGIYTIHNTAAKIRYEQNSRYGYSNCLLIKNYDSNGLYVFNYNNEYINQMPCVMIMEKLSSNAVSLKEYIDNGGAYTGNIIWNFPNAKYIYISISTNDGNPGGISGNMIAPNAHIYMSYNNRDIFKVNSSNKSRNNYYGSIISNSFNADIYSYNKLIKSNYTLNKKILDETNLYYESPVDYSDDLYIRNYSISDLLQNYSLITLGHKPIDEKSKLLEYGDVPGSIKLFHITGQALIAGNVYGKVYDGEQDEYDDNMSRYDRTSFDLECNKACESYIQGTTNTYIPEKDNPEFMQEVSHAVIQPWDNMLYDNINYLQKVNMLLTGDEFHSYIRYINNKAYFWGIGEGNISMNSINNYVNFDRLYDNVVAEQSGIAEGTKLTVGSDGVLHIPTGGTYTIEDISNIKEIVFDNFEKNKDELTIITIKNDGDINFPLVSKDDSSKAIITNDYFGKEKATHLYELDTFLSEDSYYGNIVWNIPNAGYIKLKENAPFAGHMIAPNADVETPELHFAGCFIVNSIYGEGNTEAHFYPINSDLKCVSSEYDSLSEKQKMKFNEYRIRKALGGNKTIIEKEILGDKAQYDKDVALFESLIDKGDNREIIVNPETSGIIAIILGLISIVFIGTITIRKNKKIKE